MLTELLIRNLAIIDEVCVPFREGFNVLTGETGAGKSIIIHALNFLVGGRSDIDLIRAGSETMLVEATFDINYCPQVRSVLEEFGLEPEDGTLVLSRELSRSGRSRCRVNGRAATVAVLKQIGKAIVDIHGQHDHQSLLEPSNHLRFLDSFGGENLSALKERYWQLYRQLVQVEREIDELQQSERDRIQRLDLIRYQAEEIDRANLKEGEEEELLQERQILANAEKIVERLSLAAQKLIGDGETLDKLGEAIQALKEISELDPKLGEMQNALSQVFDAIQEVGFEIERYASRIDFDPKRLEEIESRLDLIKRLKRKYGDTIAVILEYRRKIENELKKLETSEERLEVLQKERERLRQELAEVAFALSQSRQEIARQLERTVQNHLKALMMERAKFKVALNRLPDPDGLRLPDGTFAFGKEGIDQVEFLIATNPGEPLKPLAKIASGGEISR
ncbi:MAG: DNA repair protein RecN, partial [Armatimonadetes bacterium]|nr:DNA repair protein RecN [Armatimonadota bacterium]